jgi:hypothetical protein
VAAAGALIVLTPAHGIDILDWWTSDWLPMDRTVVPTGSDLALGGQDGPE